MTPAAHATLSASGAHRWITCTPSALIEAALRAEHGDASSPAAEQGTVAHALAEWKIRRLDHRLRDDAGERPVSPLIDEEMEEHTSDYATFILERASQAQADDPSFVMAVEQRLDFSHLVPGGFGTADCIIIAGNRIEVIDFKYGQGVLVEAEENPQLMLYGHGALHAFGSLYDLAEVQLTIVQPRRQSISTWSLSTNDLERWGREVVVPAAALAAQGKGEFRPGSWCQFCRIAPTCRARAEKNLEVAKHEFAPPAELTAEEIAEVLERLPQLKSWAADVEAHALSLAVNQGHSFPGFKLVEGRSIRKYTDETAVADACAAAGVDDVFDHKLKTITALEKQLGKKRFAELVGHLVHKPAGKPALVPISDKRPALTPRDPATEFTTITDQAKA
ncbi:DUF2800 domain-containing protein [Trueperella pyogenes]|uniref:DUF2800 domain-containing protein n=1 Tax=Trueperella pyogenes TaxID=1661 RepID=UPI0014331BC3|nr:DUF2800 domain-containing protein [Trueperella pyogenes]QIU87377.1 DUF2800 domain-containing protein [Trueperella pyogenes]